MSKIPKRRRKQGETTEARAMSNNLDNEVAEVLNGTEDASEGADPAKAEREEVKVNGETPGHIDDVTAPEEELDPAGE